VSIAKVVSVAFLQGTPGVVGKSTQNLPLVHVTFNHLAQLRVNPIHLVREIISPQAARDFHIHLASAGVGGNRYSAGPDRVCAAYRQKRYDRNDKNQSRLPHMVAPQRYSFRFTPDRFTNSRGETFVIRHVTHRCF
jgi:hypothetical protein